MLLEVIYESLLNPAKDILSDSLERTRAKYEALSEHVKQELLKTNKTDLITQALLMNEIENDMYYVQFLSQHPPIGMISSIDTAKLVRQTVQAEQEEESDAIAALVEEERTVTGDKIEKTIEQVERRKKTFEVTVFGSDGAVMQSEQVFAPNDKIIFKSEWIKGDPKKAALN